MAGNRKVSEQGQKSRRGRKKADYMSVNEKLLKGFAPLLANSFGFHHIRTMNSVK